MWRMIIMLCIGVLALAGCGGGGTSNPQTAQNAVAPTATPFPTLVFEERVGFTAGFIENPFRLAIRPDATIQNRIFEVLMALSPLPDESLSITTPLSSLQINDIAPVLTAFENDFMVGIVTSDWDNTATIGDLVTLLQQRVANQVALEIYERTSLYFEVVLLDSFGEGLSALCDSGTGIVTIPFLDGVTTLAAIANECGEIALQVAKSPDMALVFVPIAEAIIESTPEPTPDATLEATPDDNATLEATPDDNATLEATPDDNATLEATPDGDMTAEVPLDATSEPTPDITLELPTPTPAPTATPLPLDMDSLVTGSEGVFFISEIFGAETISVIGNRPFCRLNVRDFYSWFLPSLLLEEANIEPIAIIDKPSPQVIIEAVATGECAGAMLSADQLARIDDLDGVDIVQRTIPFPYGVLLYPLEVELGIQLRLNEILPPMSLDPQAGYALRLLLGQNALIPITSDDLANLGRLIGSTGYDLSQLGR